MLDPSTTTGAWWPEGDPLPEDVLSQFQPGENPMDGVASLSGDWILNNMPELTNLTFKMNGPVCMSNSICVAAEAIGRGLTSVCLVVKAWHNFPGRYYQGGRNAQNTVEGPRRVDEPVGRQRRHERRLPVHRVHAQVQPEPRQDGRSSS